MLRLTTKDGTEVEVDGTVVEYTRGKVQEHRVWIEGNSFLPVTVNETPDARCLLLTAEVAARLPPLDTVVRVVDTRGRFGPEVLTNPKLHTTGTSPEYLWIYYGVPENLSEYLAVFRRS